MRVGFVGLGRMGAPMAANLAAAGHELVVWTRDAEKARRFAEERGCAAAPSPRAVSEAAEAVVTMLADDAASEAVHRGPEGLFAGEGARVFLEMGTLSPGHLAALREGAGGRAVIDAPVSGATAAARDAQLMIMAGAEEAALAPVRPLLDAMGRKTIALGRPGAGAVMKLAVNALIHGLNQTVAEALNVAAAAGIAPERAYDAIEASAAGAPMLAYRRPIYLDDRAHAVTFTMALARKDLGLFLDLAAEGGVAAPQAALNRDQLDRAIGAGFGEADMGALVRYLRGGA